MNKLICHAARHNLKRFDKPASVFETVADLSFFDLAMLSYTSCESIDQIVLVCPEKDSVFFNEKLEILCNKTRKTLHLPVITPLKEDHRAAFVPENSLFNPVSMRTTDLFGLWNASYLEEFSNPSENDFLVIFNLESFWFLGKDQLKELFLMVKRNDFILSLKDEEDHILGVNYKRGNNARIKAENKRKKILLQVKQNFIHLVSRNFNSLKEEIGSLREKKFNSLMSNYNQSVFFAENKDTDPVLAAKKLLVLQSLNSGISLRNGKGIHQIHLIKNILGNLKDHPSNIFKMDSFNSDVVFPEVMQIEADGHESYDFKKFRNVLEKWNFVPFYIIKDKNDFYKKEEFLPLIRDFSPLISGRIYYESCPHGISPEQLGAFYKAGICTYVFLVDEYLEALKDRKTNLSLDNKIKSFLHVKNGFPGHYLLLKTRNDYQDTKRLDLLIQRWHYLVDGIVVTPDPHSNKAFSSKPLDSSCTRVPYEIILKTDLHFSLCFNESKGSLDPFKPEDWKKRIPDAGKMDICKNCTGKNSYALKSIKKFSTRNFESFIMENFEKSLLNDIDHYLGLNDFTSALDTIEKILRYDPVNKEAWKKIEFIREKNIEK